MIFNSLTKKMLILVALTNGLVSVAGEAPKLNVLSNNYSIKRHDGIIAVYKGPEDTCFGTPQTSYPVIIYNPATKKVLRHAYYASPLVAMKFKKDGNLYVELQAVNTNKHVFKISQ